jgi:hypothetical protein
MCFLNPTGCLKVRESRTEDEGRFNQRALPELPYQGQAVRTPHVYEFKATLYASKDDGKARDDFPFGTRQLAQK